jgi:hypothetical protein
VRRHDRYYGVGSALAVAVTGTGQLAAVLLIAVPSERQAKAFFVLYGAGIAIVYVASMAAIVVHECGHFLMARLLHEPVTGIALGSPPTWVTVGPSVMRIHIGPVPHGRVYLTNRVSAGRSALVTAAGPAANMLTAPLPLALPVYRPVTYALALIFAVVGVTNLLPYRAKAGRLSDGATLLRAPARGRADKDVGRLLADPDWAGRADATDTLLRGFQVQVPTVLGRWPALAQRLKTEDRTADLLWLHRQELNLPDSPGEQLVAAVNYLEWLVATTPGLPLADANLAGRRLPWVLKHLPADQRAAALHTLAVLRLRQGLPAEVEPLCATALAGDLEPGQRATVLATIAMARHATGSSGREALDEALVLDPGAELVGEALAWLSNPQGTGPR